MNDHVDCEQNEILVFVFGLALASRTVECFLVLSILRPLFVRLPLPLVGAL